MAITDDSQPQRTREFGVSGNSLFRDGSAVVKRHDTDLVSYYREYGVLSRLAHLPVARVLPGSHPGELRLTYVAGIPGCEFVEHGNAWSLLLRMGQFLRQLHQIDPRSVEDILPGSGPVLVHGDFAHYNCVMTNSGACLAAVLDWETAHIGNAIEDLAWCEWQFRNRYPQHAWAVSSLFEGFGSEPAWALREQSIAVRLEQLSDASVGKRPRPGHASAYFGEMRFENRNDLAAFVAGLSRFLNSPQGDEYRRGPEAVEVWQRSTPEQGIQQLWLNHEALNATASAFGHVRLQGVRRGGHDAVSMRLVLCGDSFPAWGMEEAARSVCL